MALLDQIAPYSVRAASVGGFVFSTQLFNTPKSMLKLQSIEIKPRMETDNYMVFGKTAGALAIQVDIDIKLNLSGVDYPAMAEMTGRTNTSSGSGSTERRTTDLQGGGAGLKRFGLAVACPAEDDSDVHFYFPYCICTDDPISMAFEANKFAVNEVNITAMSLILATGVTLKQGRMINLATVTALPTDFNAWKTELVAS